MSWGRVVADSPNVCFMVFPFAAEYRADTIDIETVLNETLASAAAASNYTLAAKAGHTAKPTSLPVCLSIGLSLEL